MTPRSLFAYLVGNRQAIADVSLSRGAIWLGLVLVISAGLAREYDGADLLAEPWHFALPPAASLATSLLLFLLIGRAGRLDWMANGGFWRGYRSFLALYWMTAPLAWLYAIPVERFLSPADATRANLLLLAVVATWRVGLMIRVVSVLYGASTQAATAVVMLFADTVAMVLVWFTPLPVFSLMGGIRLTESELLIHGVASLVQALGVLTWPVWLLAVALLNFRPPGAQHEANWTSHPAKRVSCSLWALAAFSVIGWSIVLPWTQREQRLSRQTEQLLRTGRLVDAVRLMSQHQRSDFPPHWDPPPRIGYGETEPDVLQVLGAAQRERTRLWVRELFLEKFLVRRQFDQAKLHMLVVILERMPDAPQLIQRQREPLEKLLRSHALDEGRLRERFRALLGRDREVKPFLPIGNWQSRPESKRLLNVSNL